MSMRPAVAGFAGCAAEIAKRRDDSAAPPAPATQPRNLRRFTRGSIATMSPARALGIVQDHLVESVAELVGNVHRFLVRTGNRVDRVEPSRQASELAERAEHPAGQIHLVDLADAADENHL